MNKITKWTLIFTAILFFTLLIFLAIGELLGVVIIFIIIIAIAVISENRYETEQREKKIAAMNPHERQAYLEEKGRIEAKKDYENEHLPRHEEDEEYDDEQEDEEDDDDEENDIPAFDTSSIFANDPLFRRTRKRRRRRHKK